MKKVFLFLSLFFFFTLYSNAQPWIQNLKEKGIEEPNFSQVRDAFYEYKQTRPELIRGEKRFKRWEYFWEKRVDENGNFPKQDFLISEWNKAQQRANAAKKTSASGVWEILGPKDAIPSGGGIGRINAITFDPIDPSILYVGTPAGGMWRSDDDGLTWFTTTDNLPCIGVSDIVINPKNRNIIYIATGDRDAGDTRSLGVFKSTDGGVTWNATGLAFLNTSNTQITKMFIHPTQPDSIVATTSNGIYRTLNGGANWTKIVNSGNYFDLEAMPNTPNTLYACTGNTIYKSVDFGLTWNQISTGTNFGSTRLMIAVTPANPNVIYVVGAKGNGGFASFYKSSDAGASWVQKATSPNILGWSTNGTDDTDGQGWYDLGLTVSPINENNIFVGGVNIWRSTNGGTNWTLNAHWYGGGGVDYVHADIHYLIFKPGSGTTLYAGCDGGVFKTQNNGGIWNDLSAGLQVQQIYKLSSSQDVDRYVISGAQDNGTNLYSEFSGNSSMEQVLGGDGMTCAIDPLDYRNMYGSLYYGDIKRSTNGGTSFQSINPPGNLKGAWVTPFALDPLNPTSIWIGYKKILKSEDMGNTWIDKTSSQPNVLGINGTDFANICVSRADGNYVLASTSSKLFITKDDGNTWSNITSGITSAATLGISSVIFHENSVDTLWVTLGGYTAANKVFKSVNGGLTWTNITYTGLPNVPINCIVHQKNSPLEDVYVGTDLGVYYTNNDLPGEWLPYNDGLPNTIVKDLVIQYKKSLLRAATYGRGLWQVSTLTPTKESTVSTNDKDKFKINNLLVLYPNPSSGEVNLSVDTDKELSTAHIYVKDITGHTAKVLYDVNFDNKKTTINLKDLPKGVYTVTVRSKKIVSTAKLTLVN